VLIKRQNEIRAHIDHVRDFFVTITNASSEDHSFKVASMADSELSKADVEDRVWENLLDPKIARDELLITEFDPFKDFLAIYCKRNGKPEVIVQDLDTKKYSVISMNNEVGLITAGMNQDYDTKSLNFHYESPFVYSQQF
jgi:protease II